MKQKLLLCDDADGVASELIDVRICDSKDHEPRLATRLLYWVTEPIDYCESCAAKMIVIGRLLLGDVVYSQPLEIPDIISSTDSDGNITWTRREETRRAIDFAFKGKDLS